MAMTMEERQVQHTQDVQANRAMGVVEYETKERLSDQVWEVEEGKVFLPGLGERGRHGSIGEGARFRPTQKQVEQTLTGRGGLVNKAHPISAAEMDSLGRESRKPVSAGADIGLRQFSMAAGTFKYAMEVGLTEDDFHGVTPSGSNGYFTREDVEAIAESRTGPAA